MLAALPPATANRLLRQRSIAIEAEIASLEQVTGSLTKSGLDRVNLIEAEYVAHMCRAELSWVRSIISDIDAGDLTWDSQAIQPVKEPTP